MDFVFSLFFARVFFGRTSHFLMEAYVSDRADLQAKVAKSKKARVKDNSRGQYANSAGASFSGSQRMRMRS